MIRHAINGKHFVFVFLDNASDVFVKLIFPFIFNLAYPVLNGKNRLDVNLSISVWHKLWVWKPNFENLNWVPKNVGYGKPYSLHISGTEYSLRHFVSTRLLFLAIGLFTYVSSLRDFCF